MLAPDGRLIGDLTCFNWGDGRYWLMGSHYLRAIHMRWFNTHMSQDVALRDVSDAVAGFSISGPSARAALENIADADLGLLRVQNAPRVKSRRTSNRCQTATVYEIEKVRIHQITPNSAHFRPRIFTSPCLGVAMNSYHTSCFNEATPRVWLPWRDGNMIYQDPSEHAPEIVDDPKKPQDHDKEIKPENDSTDDAYQYSDWASI